MQKKTRLYSDGQQFHQDNQRNNHLSPSLTEHKKTPWNMMLESQVLAWDRHK